MTHEDKQLLLKDLCARLPYYPQRPKIHIFTEGEYAPSTRIVNLVRVEMWRVRNGECQWLINDYPLEDIKPYLRPMSSMTEEEEDELNSARMGNYGEDVDWLNAHHFDYRIDPSTGKTLIESGLALEAPEGMYKTE